MYASEILHADPCGTWPEHRLSEMLLKCRTFQKIALFLREGAMDNQFHILIFRTDRRPTSLPGRAFLEELQMVISR